MKPPPQKYADYCPFVDGCDNDDVDDQDHDDFEEQNQDQNPEKTGRCKNFPCTNCLPLSRCGSYDVSQSEPPISCGISTDTGK